MDAQTTIWVDANGRTRATYVNSTAGSGGIQGQIGLISNASVQRAWNGTVSTPVPTPVTGDYQNVADYAQLVFQTAAGDLVYLTVVAPMAAIFLADQETVNPAAIAALIAACVGTLTDASGNPVTAYVGGFRRRSGREYQ